MNADHIVFEVLGTPTPQGSKSAIMVGGRPRLVEGKAGQRDNIKSWRTAVAEAARDIADDTGKLDGNLVLDVEFRFAMPASRKKADRDAGRCWKNTAPDLDKLVRAVGDALKIGGLITDDSRFVLIHATKVEVTTWTGATIAIERAA